MVNISSKYFEQERQWIFIQKTFQICANKTGDHILKTETIYKVR